MRLWPILVLLPCVAAADPVEIDISIPGYTGDWARLERVDEPPYMARLSYSNSGGNVSIDGEWEIALDDMQFLLTVKVGVDGTTDELMTVEGLSGYVAVPYQQQVSDGATAVFMILPPMM